MIFFLDNFDVNFLDCLCANRFVSALIIITLPSQKYGNPLKNLIYYNGKVPLVKCLKVIIAGERTQQKGL